MKPIPHPKPFQSALWPHLDLIRKMRLARRTWPAIAVELEALGVRLNPWAIRRFFKRAQNGKLPLGLGEAAAPVSKASARSERQDFPTVEDLLKPIPNHDAGRFAKWHQQQKVAAQDGGDIYNRARKAIREEQQARPRIIRPNKPL